MAKHDVQEDTNDQSLLDSRVATIPPSSPPMSMVEVIDKVVTKIGNPHTMCKHIVAGTTTDYLNASMDEIVMDMTLVPLVRTMDGLDIEDDSTSVALGFKEITALLSNMFNCDHQYVTKTMISKMNEFPIDDIRESYMRRQNGLLH